MRAWLIAAALCAACSSPSAPSTPPAVPPPYVPPPPPPAARLTAIDALDVTQVAGGFAISGRLQNVGDACGRDVHGKTVIKDGATVLAEMTWSLPADAVIAPGGTGQYDACCVPLSAADKDLTYTTAIEATTIACS